MCVFFFKQNTAYEMRISDCSSDVCSSDLGLRSLPEQPAMAAHPAKGSPQGCLSCLTALAARTQWGAFAGGRTSRAAPPDCHARELGRASCRERGGQSG